MGLIHFRKYPTLSFIVILVSAFLVKEIFAQCSSHQFKCSNDKCVPLSWQCDDDDDCGDNSDELNCETRTCSETEFSCANGKCVPSRWQCDNEDDCGDKSDENPSVCQNKTCQADQFSCRSPAGVCIPITWHCDGQEDCVDGSDEKDDCYQITCSEEEFTCSNNKCITKRWVCDQDNDCGDKSDEVNCPTVTCSTTEFMCVSGKCIPDRWRCDGGVDCTDGSDERDCPTEGVSVCSSREFMCANRKDCIHISWQCDGDTDCPDGSDESNCTNTCRPDQFQCKNLQCIPGQLQCNGMNECPDNSDEEGCDKIYPKACDLKTQFDCGKNHCISLDLVCNEKNDCGEWEDEPRELCHKDECKINNGGCSQKCRDLPVGYKCDCNNGYKLADNKTCEDVNECEIPGSCSQLCFNTKGGYKCECLEGYMLEPNNNHRCRAKEGHPALLFANRQDIRKIDLETYEYVSLVDELRSTVAIDYDFRTGTIVWSDVVEEAIKSAPIDTGTPVTNIVSEGIVTADGIAVDWIYGHIYWTDTGKNTIEISDRTGKMRKTLIETDLDEPRAIVLNPMDGWMYWTDWGEPAKIERAGMDGSHRSAIITTDLKWPNGLAIDFVSRKIFWVDAKLHILSSADYNGDNRRVVLSSPVILRHPFSLDVFEDWVYWTDWESEAIHRINKFNGNEMKDVAVGIFSPMDVHIYHHYKQPDGTNYCRNMNGHCSHLCLPSPNITIHSARYTCACPDGMMLTENSHTCIPGPLAPTTYLTPLWTAITEVPLVSYSGPSTTKYTTLQTETSRQNFSNGKVSIPKHYNESEGDTGRLAGIIIGAIVGLVVIIVLVTFLIYKQYLRRNVTSMNFDNPVYRKTTEDQFSLEKNQYHPARSYPPVKQSSSEINGDLKGTKSLEPLTSPGTNEFV